MSRELLLRAKNHIVDDGSLLGDYAVRYYRWSDADLNGGGSVALFRSAGTIGVNNRVVQFPDISLLLLATPALVTQADDDMLAVLRYLRSSYTNTAGSVFNFFPLNSYTGPTYLDNGRAMFEMVIRCGVTDH